MARPEKEAAVAEIREKLGAAKGSIITDYRGLTVKKVTDLRSRLRKAGVEYKVIKNTLASRAAHELDLAGLDQYLTGPTAIAFGIDDPVAPAKILADFAKDNKELEIKGGLLQGKVISMEGVKALADLPSREVLLAQVAAGMQAPISGMVQVLSGVLRSFVYALEGYRKQREEAGA